MRQRTLLTFRLRRSSRPKSNWSNDDIDDAFRSLVAGLFIGSNNELFSRLDNSPGSGDWLTGLRAIFGTATELRTYIDSTDFNHRFTRVSYPLL